MRRGCVALPLCAIGSVHPASALVFLSEFPSRRRSADQGWRATSALVFMSQGFPSLRLEVITRLLTAWWSRRRTPRGYPLGMTVPPVNPPRPGRIIAIWSGTAYSTRQAWLISQLTSISEGLSPIRHPGTRLAGDGHPTTELEVACSRSLIPVWMTLMFTQTHRVSGKLELVQSFCYKVVWNKSNTHDGWICKGDDCEVVLYGKYGLFEHLLFLLLFVCFFERGGL